jgi:hypothetical protein
MEPTFYIYCTKQRGFYNIVTGLFEDYPNGIDFSFKYKRAKDIINGLKGSYIGYNFEIINSDDYFLSTRPKDCEARINLI